MTLKKKRFSFYLHRARGISGSEGGQDKTRPATLGSQQQSLHLEDLSRGLLGFSCPESSGLRGAGFLFFLLESPQEVLKYCPERPRGVLSPSFYRPLPPPSKLLALVGQSSLLLYPSYCHSEAPSRRGTTAWRAPKGSSLWYPSWWSPSKELERPDLGTL